MHGGKTDRASSVKIYMLLQIFQVNAQLDQVFDISTDSEKNTVFTEEEI